MKMIPLYRVTADFHKPQYFQSRATAEMFIEDKPYATMDIVYCYNTDEVNRRLASEGNGEW